MRTDYAAVEAETLLVHEEEVAVTEVSAAGLEGVSTPVDNDQVFRRMERQADPVYGLPIHLPADFRMLQEELGSRELRRHRLSPTARSTCKQACTAAQAPMDSRRHTPHLASTIPSRTCRLLHKQLLTFHLRRRSLTRGGHPADL